MIAIGIIASQVAAGVLQSQELQRRWQAEFDTSTPERQQQMLAERERQYQDAKEERRHQELCQAIRDSGHHDSGSLAKGFIWGMLLGGHH